MQIAKALLFIAIAIAVAVFPARFAWGETDEPQSRPRIFAHYMTWFQTPNHDGQWNFWNWNQKGHRRDPERIFPDGRRDIASVYYPLIGPYSSCDEAVAEYHILLAKAAGIDGFVVNWYGFTDDQGRPRTEDLGFRNLIRTAERLDFKVCIDLDDKCMFPPYRDTQTRAAAVALGRDALQRIVRDYAGSPAYSRMDGKPVLTNFGWEPPFYSGQKAVTFFPDEWKTMLGGRFFFIADHQWHWNKSIFETGFMNVAQAIYPWVATDPAVRVSFYQDSRKALQAKRVKRVCGEACPGFDDWGTWGWGAGRAVIGREGGKVYRQTWDESVQHGAQWIQLITWNDFAEGTVIEPTRDFGYQYLEITAEYAAKLGHAKVNASALPLAKMIYDARVGLRSLEKQEAAAAWKSRIDQAVDRFQEGKYAPSEELVKTVAEEMKTAAAGMKATGPVVTVRLSPDAAEIHPEERAAFTVTLENVGNDIQTGKLRLDSAGEWPEAWTGAPADIRLKPGERVTRTLALVIPKGVPAQEGILEARFQAQTDLFRSAAAKVKVLPLGLQLSLAGQRLLVAGWTQELRVCLEARQKQPDAGTVALTVPKGWKAEPQTVRYELPEQAKKEILFRVSADKPGAGVVRVAFTSKAHGRQELSQRFWVTVPGDVAMFHDDINNDGSDDVVLGNDRLEAQIATNLGGRILAIYHRPTGHDQLYSDYPQLDPAAGSDSTDWREYGGINDTFPTVWPGAIWNNAWETGAEAGVEDAAAGAGIPKTLVLRCRVAQGLAVERRLSLAGGDAPLRVTCDMQNLSPQAREVIWNSHPDLAPGPDAAAAATHALLVPTAQGLAREMFAPTKTKNQYYPNAGWCVALDTASGEYLAQRFEFESGMQIGAWKGERFFTLEVMPKAFVLQPRERKLIAVDYMVGSGDWEAQIKK